MFQRPSKPAAALGAVLAFAPAASARDLNQPETLSGFRIFAETIAKDQNRADVRDRSAQILSASAKAWLEALQKAPEGCGQISYTVTTKVDGKDVPATVYAAQFCLRASGRGHDVVLNRDTQPRNCAMTITAMHPKAEAPRCVKR